MAEKDAKEETYSVIFTSLKHPLRRRILRMLCEKPLNFTEIQEALAIDSGHLNYHLDGLGELVTHLKNERYGLSASGLAAVKLMSGVEECVPIAPSRKRSLRRVVFTVYPLLLLAALLAASFFGLNYTVQGTGSLASVPVELHGANIFIGGMNQTVNFMVTTERSSSTGGYKVLVDMEAFHMSDYSFDSDPQVAVDVGFYPQITELTVPQGGIQGVYIGFNVSSSMTGFYGSGIFPGNGTVTGVGPSLPLTVHMPNGEVASWTPLWSIGNKTTEYYVPTSINVTEPGKYAFDISYGAGGIVGWNGYMTLNASWQFTEKPYFYYGAAGIVLAFGYVALVVANGVLAAKRKASTA